MPYCLTSFCLWHTLFNWGWAILKLNWKTTQTYKKKHLSSTYKTYLVLIQHLNAHITDILTAVTLPVPVFGWLLWKNSRNSRIGREPWDPVVAAHLSQASPNNGWTLCDLHRVTWYRPKNTSISSSPFWAHTQTARPNTKILHSVRAKTWSVTQTRFILAHKVMSKFCQRDVNWFHPMLLDQGRGKRSWQLCEKQEGTL